MRSKSIIVKSIAIVMSILFLAGCQEKKSTALAESETAEPETAELSDEPAEERPEEQDKEESSLPEEQDKEEDSSLPEESEQFLLPVWVGEGFETEVQTESGFEKVQNEVFGNHGYTKDYESREALLKEFGFADNEPLYQYFDQYGNLQLEVYMDDAMENICGIYHHYTYNSELEITDMSQYGFTLRVLNEGKWEERDKYLLKSVDGYDGSEFEGWVTDYESETEYREDGRPDYFESTGRIDDDTDRRTLLSINFVYREDGTLYCRNYNHNGLVFGTYLSYLDSYFDEKERVVYEKGYITHGHVEYYYIYDDESDKPAYCLYLDHNLGYVIPQMIKY